VAREWRRNCDVLSLGAIAVVVVEIEADARRAVAGGKRRWQRESNRGLRGLSGVIVVLVISVRVEIAGAGVANSRGCGGTRMDRAKVVRIADSAACLSSLLADESRP
jgi:hypothetical protein